MTTINKPVIKSQEIGKIGTIKISKEIESTIDFLHQSIGKTEWSGILFYKLNKGKISQLKNLEFGVEFIYPMNIGSSAYTEFDYSSEVMNAYDIREDLMNCSTGLTHSHHDMSTFFSGTDTTELLENASNFNYYISLIVNFTHQWCCKIAFPSTTKTSQTYTVKDENGKMVKISKTVEEQCIVIGELTVEFEASVPAPVWLKERTKELKVKKEAAAKAFTHIAGRTYPGAAMAPYTPIKGFSTNGNVKSYNDYDSFYTKPTFFPMPKDFLCTLLALGVEGKEQGLETCILETETMVEEGEVDYDTFDTAIQNNLEILHKDLYGNDSLLQSHCKSALFILENNAQLFSDLTIYEILEANLNLYAN